MAKKKQFKIPDDLDDKTKKSLDAIHCKFNLPIPTIVKQAINFYCDWGKKVVHQKDNTWIVKL